MKKNTKGFTLVELLAVIVILAIIALIATPIILGVIDDARKGAAKSAALGYIDAVEKQIAIDDLKSTKVVTLPTEGGAFTNADIAVKGSKPSAVALKYSGGKIADGTVTITGYTVTIDANGNATGVEKAS